MRAGRLRHLVAIQAKATAGAPPFEEPAWADVATVRAEVWAIKGDERQLSAQTTAQVSHRVRMRAWPGLTTAHRLAVGSATYNVQFINDVDGRGREYIVDALENVGRAAQ